MLFRSKAARVPVGDEQDEAPAQRGEATVAVAAECLHCQARGVDVAARQAKRHGAVGGIEQGAGDVRVVVGILPGGVRIEGGSASHAQRARRSGDVLRDQRGRGRGRPIAGRGIVRVSEGGG